MKNWMLALLAIAALSGCADHIVEPRGTSIALKPTEFNFAVQSQDQVYAMNKLTQFVRKYPNQAGSKWQITSYNAQGKKLAQHYRIALLQQGVAAEQLVLEHRPESHRFDVQVSVIQLQAQLEVCHQEVIGDYGLGHLGCYTDGSRWQSMVNPQNAL
ncbi:hypothetical protein [Vibrio jasicida]|uniref:hypothetical protein n=1 Tax=Vibrio jasicida TaxID=766224 RepID=UPI001640D772|nr:hypothetical protein [Vibrio jasicida]CAH1605774.1 conserved exported hypothetical protein [Vibrio jasicida]